MKRDKDRAPRKGVVDATEPRRFRVDWEKHVKGSRVAHEHDCAAACALQHEPDIEDAWVKLTRTIIKDRDGRLWRWRNPKALERAVLAQDGGGGFTAGVYDLLPITYSQSNRNPKRKGAKHTDDGTQPSRSKPRPSRSLR